MLPIRKFVRRKKGRKNEIVNGQIFEKAANLWPYFKDIFTAVLSYMKPLFVSGYFTRVSAPIEMALKSSGMTMSEVHEAILVGAGRDH